MRAAWLILPLLLASATQARAQSCAAAATAAAFGPYQPLSGADTGTTATVTVTCNPGMVPSLISYTIALGTGTGGSYAGRSMAGPQTRLGYQLYRDIVDTQIWGDGTAGTVTCSDGYALGTAFPIGRSYTAYGRIAAGQNAGVGSYLDTIMVVVSY